MAATYDPWAEVEKRTDLIVAVTFLAGGTPALHGRTEDGRHRCILLADWLPEADRTAHLAHELAHDERGGGCHHPGIADRLRPMVSREEARCDAIAAGRLLPLDELRAWVDGEIAGDQCVTIERAATELDVAEWVAALQLRRLGESRVAA